MTKDYKWERERLSRFCTWCEIVFRYDKEADFPFVEVDDGFCRMLGYEREELMESCHERIRYLIYPPDFQRIEQDVLRQLARLAFGRVDDAVTLALRRGETEPEGLELSAVSELRVTEKGVEVKLVDRVRALETLWKLLEASEPQQADPLLQALAALPEETGDWNEK